MRAASGPDPGRGRRFADWVPPCAFGEPGPGRTWVPRAWAVGEEALAGSQRCVRAGLAWTRSRTAGARGERMWGTRAALGSLLDFFFCFLFLKKKKIWFPRGRCECPAGPPGGGEARRSALQRRPGGVSLEKGALCGGPAGGQGTGSSFPLLVYSAENRWLLMQPEGREGASRVPPGSGQVCVPPSSGGSDTWLSLWPCLSPGIPESGSNAVITGLGSR